jgi:hypothetical protein
MRIALRSSVYVNYLSSNVPRKPPLARGRAELAGQTEDNLHNKNAKVTKTEGFLQKETKVTKDRVETMAWEFDRLCPHRLL